MSHPQSARFLRAAYEGNVKSVKQFLAEGVPVDTPHSSGLQALHFAAKTGNSELAETLIQHGAKVNSATQKGNTPLHVAALLGKAEFVKLLLTHDADVNALSTSNEDSFSPLYMAAQIGHQEIVTLLLAHGADTNFSTKNGSTPKLVAFQQGHKVVGELLEEYEQRIKSSQNTPIKSPQNGHKENCAPLNGAKANNPTNGHTTPTANQASGVSEGASGWGGAVKSKGTRLKMCAPPMYDEMLPSPRCSPRKINSRKGSLVDQSK